MAVVSEGVWQCAHPIRTKTARPFTVEGVSGAGIGGASIRMKFAKASISEITAGLWLEPAGELGVKFSVSSGVGLKIHPAVSSRSWEKSWFVTPISTLYASPANISSDLFCAFQPKRVMVPSLALRLTLPPWMALG